MKKALSPLDGRYAEKMTDLRDFFSEEALMRFRCYVEVKWLQFLSERKDISGLRAFTAAEKAFLDSLFDDFSEADFSRIQEIAAVTNHDVKAVEYFLKEKLQGSSLKDTAEWVHFVLTSEDINNLAYALMLREGIRTVLYPEIQEVNHLLGVYAQNWKEIPMLARTHGQPASPTTMGKEFLIFKARVARQLKLLEAQEFLGKLAGASGNFNAHAVVYPAADWLNISQMFVESLELTWNPVVPQIEPHDFLAEISHLFVRINTILIDLSRDTWGYISLGFFRQRLKAGEVGSSAMPHKVNPIDFENAEGNFGLSTALFSHFAEKLPISRWQRDLTDSTVLRNFGVAFGHHLLALKSLRTGLTKLELAEEAITKDLNSHPEILAEAIQTVLRTQGAEKPYEALKELTRGNAITLEDFRTFIVSLELPADKMKVLLSLTPKSYIGLSTEIVNRFNKD